MFRKNFNKVMLFLLILVSSLLPKFTILAQTVTSVATETPEIYAPPREGQVNITEAIVRETPDITSAIIKRLPIGTIVSVVAHQGDWEKIATPEIPSGNGWVLTDFLTFFPSGAEDINMSEATPISSSTQLSNISLNLVEPLDSEIYGQRTFKWETNIILGANQAFEMIFWKVGQDPVIDGFSPAGTGRANTISVDLESIANTIPQLVANEEYQWGVLLVEITPYRRLKYLGGGHRFRFKLLPLLTPSTESLSTAKPPTPTLTSPPTPTPTLTSPPTPTPTLTSPPTPTPTLMSPPTPTGVTPTATPTFMSTALTPTPTATSTFMSTAPTSTPTFMSTAPTSTPTFMSPPTPTGVTPTAVGLVLPTSEHPTKFTATPTNTPTPTPNPKPEVRVHHGKQGYTDEQVKQSYELDYVPPFIFGQGTQILHVQLAEMVRYLDNGVELKGGQLIASIPFHINDDGSVEEIVFHIPDDSIIILQTGDQEGHHFDVSRYIPVPYTKDGGHVVVHASRIPGGIWYFELAGDFDMSRSRDVLFMAEVASQHMAREIGGTVMENSVGRALGRKTRFGLWQRPDVEVPDGPWASQYMAAQCNQRMYYNTNVTPHFVHITGAVSFDDLRDRDTFWRSLHSFPAPPDMDTKYQPWYCKNVKNSWQPPLVR